MRLPKRPKSILNLYGYQMLVFNSRNAILTHENPILDTKIVILCITVQKL